MFPFSSVVIGTVLSLPQLLAQCVSDISDHGLFVYVGAAFLWIAHSICICVPWISVRAIPPREHFMVTSLTLLSSGIGSS